MQTVSPVAFACRGAVARAGIRKIVTAQTSASVRRILCRFWQTCAQTSAPPQGNAQPDFFFFFRLRARAAATPATPIPRRAAGGGSGTEARVGGGDPAVQTAYA